MESNQGSEVKQEVSVVPEMKNENNDAFSAVKESGNGWGEKLGGADNSVLRCSEDFEKTEEMKGNGTVCVTQESIGGHGENVVNRHNKGFLVGDLVWGKIKSHPWWPGLIYDPSDASEFALKFKNQNKFLVAYFGDGSCAWCSPSQLVPFVENYEKMSKQSRSNIFVDAVKEALEEFCRRVELKMIRSCVPKGELTDLVRPEAMNAGVRSGVLIPDGAIGKLPSPWSEPALVLEYVRNLKQAGPVSNLLELVLIKSWLSAFSRVKRGCCLPIYGEPQLIEGLEDKSKNTGSGTNDFSVPIAVPIQGPSEEECAGSPKTLPVKGLMVTSTQKRKQKSVAELMTGNKGDKLKGLNNSEITKETHSSTAKNKKKADVNENAVSRANDGLSNSVENESLRSMKRKQDEDTVHDDINAPTAGRKRGKKKANSRSVMANDGVDDADGDSDDKTLKRFISRARKNSKYLSAPYTIPSPKLWRSYSRREQETKSDKTATLSKIGERLTKVAGQLISSPHLTQCNNAVSEENMSGNCEKKTDNFSMDISAAPDQVCAEVLSAGVDIMSMDKSSIGPLKAFMSAFRSSMYSDKSNNELYEDQESGQKRKSSPGEPRDIATDLNNAAVVSEQPVAHSEKTDKPRSRVTKLKKAARAAAANKKESDKTSPDALIISFGSDASLPTKDEIIMTFSKFGGINEDETKLLHDSNCAQVVFIITSNAELAFKESVKESPFSGNHVEYNLRYSFDASTVLESVKVTSRSPRKRSPKKPVCKPTGGDVSQVDLVLQNLGSLTSMLNQCNGKISAEEKSSFEGEIRTMLQKVEELRLKASS